MTKIKTSFSGHDKFECKIDWISKGLLAYKEDNKIFLQSNIEKSIEKLGLGINMIKSLNHWMKVLGLIDNNTLSQLGEIVLKNDPYLENSDTLWLLHWNLVKDREKTTLTNLFFNKYYPHKFNKEDIVNRIALWLDENNIKLSPTTLNSDMDVFIRMYRSNDGDDISMSLFADLNIITKLSNGNYSLNINSTTTISDKAFLYILFDYIEMKYGYDVESISIDDIQRGVLSIQKSLCMSENTLYSKIHALGKLTNNKISYSEASGIRQIYISDSVDKSELLTKIYQ